MEAIRTRKNEERKRRNREIAREWKEYSRMGSDKMAVCELLASKYGLHPMTIYNIINRQLREN